MILSSSPDLDPLLERELGVRGIGINRRNYNGTFADKIGRLRLGMLSVTLFLVVYVCFTIGVWVDHRPDFVVNVPPNDDTLPGPKGMKARSNPVINTPITSTNIIAPTTNISASIFHSNSNATTLVTTTKSASNAATTRVTSIANQITTTTIATPIANATLTATSPVKSVPTTITTKSPQPPTPSVTISTKSYPTYNHSVPAGYLVWSPGCMMPSLNPLADDVMQLFTKEKYEECSTKQPLTSVRHDYATDSVFLELDELLKASFYHKSNAIQCCYEELQRSGSGQNSDMKFNTSECVHFNKTVALPQTIEFLIVTCKSGGKTTYTNTHAVVRRRETIKKRLTQFKSSGKKRPLSVLMMAIDSISRLNLIRAMPNTAQHLYDTGWFELQGYNKMDDNTFPNLMAILTGYNSTEAYGKCIPKKVGGLDGCPFIWNNFRKNGYVTAYGEDEASISTFNYHKVGFHKQPTDFYMRPYMLAAEKNLHFKLKHSLKFCLGYKHSADHIYDYALDFVSTYKNEPYFGLFWTNTFSHNDISDPSSMDLKVLKYLQELEVRETLNNSMVVFLSDHGIRFGPVRNLHTGWLEERLPFIFIWLPEWFKQEYPDIVQYLKINRNRLTNPYDLHMTLKHILELSERVSDLPPAPSCPTCQSLFTEIPWNRSCDECGIEAHWCTCTPYSNADISSSLVKTGVDFTIDHINSELNKNANGSQNICDEVKLRTIRYARLADYKEVPNIHYTDVMFVFDANPGDATFEATLRYYAKTKKFEMTGSVSRLNSYASTSGCMNVDYLKKYCHCKHKKG